MDECRSKRILHPLDDSHNKETERGLYMRTLFLAWQEAATRAWYPIGRLDADVANSRFKFRYTHGAEMAQEHSGLQPLDSFPDFHKTYESSDLFPLFRNRIMGEGREDFKEYVRQLDLNPDHVDPLEILALTGGERQTDNLEVFPKIERHKGGGFRCRFFLHGWRHVNESAQQKLLGLKGGEELRVAVELNNPVTVLALQMETPDDYHMIGWAPRYLVKDLFRAICEASDDIRAKVVKVNPSPAPTKQRILIEIKGRWPVAYVPMSSPEFEPLTGTMPRSNVVVEKAADRILKTRRTKLEKQKIG
jgi:hypothetical protein